MVDLPHVQVLYITIILVVPKFFVHYREGVDLLDILKYKSLWQLLYK